MAPIAELTYRPMGYNGPILTIDYERGIRGMLGSDTDYERLEIDGQYKHHLSALSYLQLRAGTGFYTHKGFGSYFLDYSNFRENNIPGGWNDDWACSFELLNSGWYKPRNTTCVPMLPTRLPYSFCHGCLLPAD